jgi:GrpB-like predicted nucleotidyltransferase (UPF0157 family)
MLGLNRGIVEVVPYNPEWREAFQIEKSQLQSLLGKRCLDIQHIGSTAIPGMVAKPVLDIGVAVAEISVIFTCVEEMIELGYVYFGDQRERGDFFFAKVTGEQETCFVHMLESADPAWQEFLRFRDHLIENAYDRERYKRLKTKIAARYVHNRRAYTDAKAEFILEILRQTEDSQ